MSKNIVAPQVQIWDTSGNTISFVWSKEKAVSVTTDFEPGFPFQIYVGTAGNIQYIPWSNDLEDLPTKEKVFFSGATVTKAVADGTYIPVLCKKIIASGTTATGIVIGR